MNIKTNPLSQVPDLQKIKDKMTKEFSRDLVDLISKTIRNAYDDIVALEKVERVANYAALPTAALSNRGKLYLVEGTAGAADALYISMDTGATMYGWGLIGIT